MHERTPATVLELLVESARTNGEDAALLAPDRPPTSYTMLLEHVRAMTGALRARGLSSSDRIALLVEPGPEAASAFLTIASAAVCAPLNPSYREAELDFYLGDLSARMLVVGTGVDTPARDVARSLGIDVLELSVTAGAPAGMFRIDGLDEARVDVAPTHDAEALVLHTSGTTARPKIVPLAHRNLMASARNVSSTLALESTDRCLNVMPLFHIHGLVAALLASLHTGGSVVCAPGFHQLRVFEWMRELSPTWMTAVPTMYQAIVERILRDPALRTGHTLRFVRSSSAALPVSVLEGIEDALGVPVIEAYGMTEAAHQMTSNPLPPLLRRPGSVGLPAGPEVTILDEEGGVLKAGAVGEVAVRGENVFDGYESNPEANTAAFVDGWFRTGDLGTIDDDGYVVVQGRLKEIINRAGEKISPLEVDDVLLRHPAVAEAVTFGVPHERLGEEVAAAVVPRAGRPVDADELQDFVAQTVAPYKVPRAIVLVSEIPKGPTGKVQRVSLAERLELTGEGAESPDPKRNEYLDESIREIWGEVLGLPDVDAHDDFFALGGDSILGAEAVARVRDLVANPDLPLVAIVRSPTPRKMAIEVEKAFAWGSHDVVAFEPANDSGIPLFFVHGVDGDIVRFAPLARMLGSTYSGFGLRAPGFEPGEDPPTDIESLASTYLDGIRQAQPSGPYRLVSYCMGAAIALEIARRLEARGETTRLVLVDPRLRRPGGMRYDLWLAGRRLRQRRLVSSILRRFRPGGRAAAVTESDRGAVWAALESAREAYVSRPTTMPVALLRSTDFERFEMPPWYLRSVFPRVVLEDVVEGKHISLFQPRETPGLDAAIAGALSRLESAS